MISGPLPRLNAPTLQPDRPILALANSRFVPPRPFFPSHPLPQPRFVCPSSRKGNEEYYRLVIGGATFRYPPRNRCDFSLLPSIDVSEREAPSLSRVIPPVIYCLASVSFSRIPRTLTHGIERRRRRSFLFSFSNAIFESSNGLQNSFPLRREKRMSVQYACKRREGGRRKARWTKVDEGGGSVHVEY